MSLRTILAPISGANGDKTALDAALAVARRFDAHIEVLHVSGDPRDAVPFLGEGASGALIEQIMDAAAKETKARAQRARKTFDEWMAAASLPAADRPGQTTGASAAWRPETGAEDQWVARRGRLADLIVAAPPAEAGKLAWTIVFEAALLDTGRPILSVSPSASMRPGEGTVVVGWNGSAQASRAVAAAMPFLATAPRVVVVSMAEKGVNASPADLVTYLGWHGVRAEARTPEAKGASVGAVLLSEAADAGLLVMGAYTHNRLREMIFGGVTRHVLENAMVPVLMAH